MSRGQRPSATSYVGQAWFASNLLQTNLRYLEFCDLVDELRFPAVWLRGEGNGSGFDIWRQLFEKLDSSVYIAIIRVSAYIY
jgi:hypothetical protein